MRTKDEIRGRIARKRQGIKEQKDVIPDSLLCATKSKSQANSTEGPMSTIRSGDRQGTAREGERGGGKREGRKDEVIYFWRPSVCFFPGSRNIPRESLGKASRQQAL